MTIEQALDKILEVKQPNLEQQDLKFSLVNLKMEHGGRKTIENVEQVENIILHGSKDGKQEKE